ncbi:MAG: trimethylamine methyltransferase family protein [Clostridia bacterium]|nr:trimethylamine methyltransferase family protein [Clostridia bacterium]
MLWEMKVLSKDQVEELHFQTLELLNTRGIAIHHEPTKKLLIENGAAAGKGDIIKIPKELIENRLKLVPKSFEIKARNRNKNITIGKGETILVPTGGPVFVHDHIRGRRKGKLADVIDFYKLSQTSSQIQAVCAGILDPNDIREEYKHLVLMKELVQNCDKPLMGISMGAEVAQDCIGIAKIAVEPEQGDCFIFGVVNTLSPMAWDERMLEAIWVYAKNSQPVVVTCCSMAGFTSPTSLWGTILQNNAEVITGILVAQLINPGCPVVYGNTSTITDMKTMNLCIGAPEYGLLTTAFKQLADFYRVPFRGGGGLTDGKEVDVQTGVESTTNLLFTFGNKVDIVLHGVGVMESFLTVSYEKWIWDEEISGRIRRILQGVDMTQREDAISLAGDVDTGGHYLEHPDTFARFRKEFYTPLVSDRNNWSTWHERNINSVKNAWEKVQQRLKEFEKPELESHVLSLLIKHLRGKLPEKLL